MNDVSLSPKSALHELAASRSGSPDVAGVGGHSVGAMALGALLQQPLAGGGLDSPFLAQLRAATLPSGEGRATPAASKEGAWAAAFDTPGLEDVSVKADTTEPSVLDAVSRRLTGSLSGMDSGGAFREVTAKLPSGESTSERRPHVAVRTVGDSGDIAQPAPVMSPEPRAAKATGVSEQAFAGVGSGVAPVEISAGKAIDDLGDTLGAIVGRLPEARTSDPAPAKSAASIGALVSPEVADLDLTAPRVTSSDPAGQESTMRVDTQRLADPGQRVAGRGSFQIGDLSMPQPGAVAEMRNLGSPQQGTGSVNAFIPPRGAVSSDAAGEVMKMLGRVDLMSLETPVVSNDADTFFARLRMSSSAATPSRHGSLDPVANRVIVADGGPATSSLAISDAAVEPASVQRTVLGGSESPGTGPDSGSRDTHRATQGDAADTSSAERMLDTKGFAMPKGGFVEGGAATTSGTHVLDRIRHVLNSSVGAGSSVGLQVPELGGDGYMDLKVQGTSVELEIRTSDPVSRAELTRIRPQIEAALRDAGLTLGAYRISAGENFAATPRMERVLERLGSEESISRGQQQQEHAGRREQRRQQNSRNS